MKKIIINILLILMINQMQAFAGTIGGTTLSYKILPSGIYEFELEVIRECTGGLAPSSVAIAVEIGGAFTYSKTKNLPLLSNTNYPYNGTTTCQSITSLIPGFNKTIYKDTMNLNLLGVFVGCRSSIASRIVSTNLGNGNAGNDVQVYLYSVNVNQTPTFTTECVIYPNSTGSNTINIGGVDANLDSIVYQFVNPIDSFDYSFPPYTYVTFNAGYSLVNLVGSGGSMVINPTTGDITYTIPNDGIYCATVKISEYRNGLLSTNTFRDLVFVQKSNSNPPIGGITVSPSSTICANTPITLTGFGGLSYSWTGGVINGVPFTPTTSGIYTLTITNSNNIIQTLTQAITVNPEPILSVITTPTNATVCSGVNTTLTGTGANTYSWSGGITNATAFTPTANGTYTLTGTDANGCSATATKTIYVVPNPNVSITSSNLYTCGNDSITVYASGANTYVWDETTAMLTQGFTGNTLKYKPTLSGMCYVYGTDINGCVSIGEIFITVDKINFQVFNNTNPMLCDSVANISILNITPNNYCIPSVQSCSSTSPYISTVKDLAVASNGFPSSCDSYSNYSTVVPNLLNVRANNIFNFSARVKNFDTNDCVNVWIDSNFNGVFETNEHIKFSYKLVSGTTYRYYYQVMIPNTTKFGKTKIRFMLSDSSTNNACNPNGYEIEDYDLNIAPDTNFKFYWSNSGGIIDSGYSIFVNPSIITTYTVASTSANGCSDSSVITVQPISKISLVSNKDSICFGNSATLSASGGTNYSWLPNIASNNNNQLVFPSINTVYTVTGSVGSATCSATKLVNVIPSPNVEIDTNLQQIPICAGIPVFLNATILDVNNYCTQSMLSSDDEEIVKVTFGSFSNISDCNTIAPGIGSILNSYANYNSLGAIDTVNAGSTIPFSISIGSCDTLNYVSGVAIFIDYNNDGDFADSNEKAFSMDSLAGLNCVPSSILNGFINIPLTAVNGITKMRIINVELVGYDQGPGYSPNPILPCIDYYYGEIEDYLINITGGLDNYLVSWSPSISVNTPNKLNTFATLNSSSIYTVTVTNSLGCSSSGTKLINVINSGSYTVSASICNGQSYLGYTIAGIYKDTFVNSAGCDTIRTLQLVVDTMPNLTISTNSSSSSLCNGASVIITASGANTYSWSGGITNGIAFTTNTSATYTVSGTNGACVNTSSITISSTANGSDLAQSLSLISSAGTSCDLGIQSDGLTVSYHDTNCNLVATVIDANGGNVLGNVSTCVTVDSSIQAINGQPYVARHYNITPTNNGPATITLYFTQDDFNDYNLHPNVVNNTYPAFPTSGNNADSNIANIRVAKYAGSTGLGSTNVDEIIPNSVIFANGIWTITFNVNGFSSFYLHGVNANNTPLIINNIELQATLANNNVVLDWEVLQQNNIQYYEVAKANKDLIFEKIANVNANIIAAETINKTKYKYIDNSYRTDENYYQITQIDINGKKVKSNIAYIITYNNVYNIFPNPIKSIASIFTNVAMSETIQIEILDVIGKVIVKQKNILQKGANTIELPMAEISSGTYTIRIINSKGFVNNLKVQKQ